MDQNHEIKGIVNRFLFQNNENGYVVFALEMNANTSVTVCGYLPSIQAGQEVILQGDWTLHPKFGKQFEAHSCTAQIPTTIVGLKKYLGSGMIKGIGPAYAEKLVSYFGAHVLEIIDQQPKRLHEVPGIGAKRVELISTAWKDQKEISNVMVYLQDKGVSPAYAAKIYKAYGQNSIAMLTENPYRLAEDIWGIGFKTADQIAQVIGIARNSLKRVKAGLLFAISNCVGQGHIYAELTHLKKETIALLELEEQESEPLLKSALHDQYNDGKIKLITHNDLHYITLSQYYFSEKGAAQKLKILREYPQKHMLDINAIYTALRTTNKPGDIILNEEQQRGIMACLQNKLTVITGGPGTGKTTLIKKLLAILDEHKLVYRLAAPTGRAAKRITEGTGRVALTIHRLLEFDASSYGFSRNEQNALALDFLIIDEASMIDIFLAHAILKALPQKSHLILIGDVDQLPSVGAGNFLQDLIASNVATTVALKEIFRQAQDSLIIVNAHRVNQGQFPVSSLPDAKRDFIFIKEDDPGMVSAHLNELFTKQIPRMGIRAENAIVLVPMNRGIVGTQQLNMHLQNLLNPPQQDTKRISHGIYSYTIGDRVMQIRNNYDKIVFNGDTGTVQDINLSDKIMLVNYYDRIVTYEYNELDELVLAYAISIHKSQGSEYPAVIIPLFMQHFTLLQRNLVYTAITRAKKLCILIGQTRAIAMAIKNNKNHERITFLKQFLTTDLQCR